MKKLLYYRCDLIHDGWSQGSVVGGGAETDVL